MKTSNEPIYFGCIRESGHYFHPLKGYKTTNLPENWPWGYEVDGKLQPEKESQGSAKLHHKDGWTCLAWWDRTVDKRPASTSAIAIREEGLKFQDMADLLLKHYPEISKRQIVALHIKTEKEK